MKRLLAAFFLVSSFALSAQMKFDKEIEATLPVLIPLGEYGDLSNFSSGLEAQLHLVPQFMPELSLFADIQILGNVTTVTGTSLYNLGVSAGGEYRLKGIGPEPLTISAQAGIGIYINIANGEWNENVSGINVFTSPMIFIAPGASWKLGPGEIIGRIKYSTFIESANAGHLIGLQFGYRIKL